ncbi:hypothetical protein SAMN04244574_04699 [Azotobacter beijerinckii]|uniref:Uncharacterized protein n=1 Tax=Azotobacter beijerinckii TaxID=170623 RepID=A0A1I4IUW4_9GAMM|nr:hypothetical protein SAMN04244571_04787 [Azotobacter beijerinckii]SFL58159.1 hypothetical protein SAMN04244574_04699 [Azotobacter beijerinckii]
MNQAKNPWLIPFESALNQSLFQVRLGHYPVHTGTSETPKQKITSGKLGYFVATLSLKQKRNSPENSKICFRPYKPT